jgi:hypothetical protein
VGGNKLESPVEMRPYFLAKRENYLYGLSLCTDGDLLEVDEPRHPISILIGYPVVGDLINYGLDVRFQAHEEGISQSRQNWFARNRVRCERKPGNGFPGS